MNPMLLNVNSNHRDMDFHDFLQNNIKNIVHKMTDLSDDYFVEAESRYVIDVATRVNYQTVHHDEDEFVYYWIVHFDRHLSFKITVAERDMFAHTEDNRDLYTPDINTQAIFETFIDGYNVYKLDDVHFGLSEEEVARYGKALALIEEHISTVCEHIEIRSTQELECDEQQYEYDIEEGRKVILQDKYVLRA